MRTADLVNRLEDRPFKAFRMLLSDGTRIDVVNPGLVIPGLSSTVVATEFAKDDEGHIVARRWRTIALSHIVQFTDTDDHANGKKKRRPPVG